jgi:glycosyltransferase involved in cell wall biosynthesis
MEAIAARVLIAASKIDGISGLARDGIEVLLGPPKDTDALQNAILKLLRNSEIGIKRRERSFSRVKEMFGVEVMAKKIELIYSRLLDRS